jgi:Uma2 family endonuclease
MVRALPEDGKRYEVLDGELFVSPAPRLAHQAVLGRLFRILSTYVEQHSIGWVFMSPADIEFAPNRVVQPDAFVVGNMGQGRPQTWAEARPLILVAEVKSESTARADRFIKRRIYREERIPVYWILDLDARMVECWTPDDERPEMVFDLLTWQPKAEVARLEIHLPDFFASALD